MSTQVNRTPEHSFACAGELGAHAHTGQPRTEHPFAGAGELVRTRTLVNRTPEH